MFYLCSTSVHVTWGFFWLHQRIVAHHVTLAAPGAQLGRDGNGLQWQTREEQGISLCFSKIVVRDADSEVKMKDVLWYFIFFLL